MNAVPQGKLITIYEICKMLAKKHKVKFCCSLTTGIFINIAAHAAEESKEKGEKNTTPYWRTIKTDGVLNHNDGGVLCGWRNCIIRNFWSWIQKVG